MDKIKEERPHLFKKKGGGGTRHKEGSEDYTRCQKRYKMNFSADLEKKNIFCKYGEGKKGMTDAEMKAKGKDFKGCKYYCRTAKTMSKHEEKCKFNKE